MAENISLERVAGGVKAPAAGKPSVEQVSMEPVI